MEISWFGEACVRLRAKEGSVAADAFRTVLGPTGRGLSADIATYSHPDADLGSGGNGRARASSGRNGASVIRPSSLEPAFALEGPGEYEIHGVLVNGVRTYRDDARGAERGANVAFVFELEGIHVVHLGDIGHLLTEDQVGEIGSVDVVCVPVGGSLPAARAAELVAQLDAKLVIPLPHGTDDPTDPSAEGTALDRFLHEMGVQHPQPQPKLAITASSLPDETTLVLLEARARV